MLIGGLPGKEDIKAMDRADAVILPQGCGKEVYLLARQHCSHVFPDYEARFHYPGKTGQARLFSEHMAPCPGYLVLEKIEDYSAESLPFNYPFVVKGAWGGEGNNVVLIENDRDFEAARQKVLSWLKNGGCLVQQYIPSGGKSLRVVVIGRSFYPYWRINQKGGFYSNLAKGAVVCSRSFKSLQERALNTLRPFCRSTGINLAGFDFIFSSKVKDPQPFFLEINYSFRTRGLGGPDYFLELMAKEVRQWIADLD